MAGAECLTKVSVRTEHSVDLLPGNIFIFQIKAAAVPLTRLEDSNTRATVCGSPCVAFTRFPLHLHFEVALLHHCGDAFEADPEPREVLKVTSPLDDIVSAIVINDSLKVSAGNVVFFPLVAPTCVLWVVRVDSATLVIVVIDPKREWFLLRRRVHVMDRRVGERHLSIPFGIDHHLHWHEHDTIDIGAVAVSGF